MEFLTFCNKQETAKIDLAKLNQKTVVFEQIKVEWPTLEPIQNMEQAITTFKLGNTQFQKALKVFVIDGYVTEHVKIIQDVSKLYKQLSVLETDTVRLTALH